MNSLARPIRRPLPTGKGRPRVLNTVFPSSKLRTGPAIPTAASFFFGPIASPSSLPLRSFFCLAASVLPLAPPRQMPTAHSLTVPHLPLEKSLLFEPCHRPCGISLAMCHRPVKPFRPNLPPPPFRPSSASSTPLPPLHPLLPLLLLLLLLGLAIPLRLHAAAGLRPHGDLIFCWAAIDCFRGFLSFSSTGSLTLVWLQSWSAKAFPAGLIVRLAFSPHVCKNAE